MNDILREISFLNELKDEMSKTEDITGISFLNIKILIDHELSELNKKVDKFESDYINGRL